MYTFLRLVLITHLFRDALARRLGALRNTANAFRRESSVETIANAVIARTMKVPLIGKWYLIITMPPHKQPLLEGRFHPECIIRIST